MAPGAGPMGGGGPSSPGGGAIPKIPRGPSARSVLKLAWEYPTYVESAEAAAGQTAAKRASRALSREEALKYIAGDDPRPLLILRECKTCNGTDDALLSRGVVDNEKTFLLARWFRCIKLPVAVLEKDHPFHNLFDEKDPEHMFVCSADGSWREGMESERSRSELWNVMTRVLAANYDKAPEDMVKRMHKTIDAFDAEDIKVVELEKKIDKLLETDGPESKKLAKAQEELAESKVKRAELFAQLDKLTGELKLRGKPLPEKSGAASKPADPAKPAEAAPAAKS